MIKYDFNNVDKQTLIDESKKDNDQKIFTQSNISKENEIKGERENNSNIDNIDNINNNDNIINEANEISNTIEEEKCKKYKITFLGENIMNLPANYSTDYEEEYKFINFINEPKDNYELVSDSKKIKIYAKIVS